MRVKEYPELGERVYRTRLPGGLIAAMVPHVGYKCSVVTLRVPCGADTVRVRRGNTVTEYPAGLAALLGELLSARTGFLSVQTDRSGTDFTYRCMDVTAEALKAMTALCGETEFSREEIQLAQTRLAEKRRACGSDPICMVQDSVRARLFGQRPTGKGIYGTAERLAEVTPEMLSAYHRLWYGGSAALCVCTDDVPERILGYLDGCSIPGLQEHPVCEYGTGEQTVPEPREIMRGNVPIPVFSMGALLQRPESGGALLRQRLTAELVFGLLTGAESSLIRRLEQEGRHVRWLHVGSRGDSVPWLEVTGVSGDPCGVCARFAQHAADLSAEGTEKDRVEREKTGLYGAFLRQLDDPVTVSEEITKGMQLGYDWLDTPNALMGLTSRDAEQMSRLSLAPDRLCMASLENIE